MAKDFGDSQLLRILALRYFGSDNVNPEAELAKILGYADVDEVRRILHHEGRRGSFPKVARLSGPARKLVAYIIKYGDMDEDEQRRIILKLMSDYR